MSEEEKEAIENLKIDVRYSDLLTAYNDDIDTILNLIEKQQKEIKNLKADIEYYKNRLSEIEEYYLAIIEQKDDEISELKDEIMKLRYRE